MLQYLVEDAAAADPNADAYMAEQQALSGQRRDYEVKGKGWAKEVDKMQSIPETAVVADVKVKPAKEVYVPSRPAPPAPKKDYEGKGKGKAK